MESESNIRIQSLDREVSGSHSRERELDGIVREGVDGGGIVERSLEPYRDLIKTRGKINLFLQSN